jgi:hypothetical protein
VLKMATFYGQVIGRAATAATRCGSAESHIFASLQSYNGSVQTELYYDERGALCVQVYAAEGSKTYGRTIYRGTVERFVSMCEDEMRSGSHRGNDLHDSAGSPAEETEGKRCA